MQYNRFGKSIVALILIVFNAHIANAQFDHIPLSARSQAMSGASVAIDGMDGAYINPAALGWMYRWTISIDYRQLFILKGMAYKSISATAPTGKIGTIAAFYNHFGDLTYNEQSASIHYGIRVAKNISVGVAVFYLHSGTNDGHYESFNSATGSIGIQYNPNNKLTFGAAIFNPFFVKRDAANRVPIVMNVGASYKPLKSFLVTVDLEKNIYTPLRVHLGAEYCLFDQILLQAGMATSPFTYSIGVGYQHFGITANVCMGVSHIAGITPGVTLGYSF